MQRKITRQIRIGSIAIGGGAPISVQSMTNTKTQDAQATVRQIEALAAAGCDIVRLAVPDKPLEIVRVIRSFDPCMACATHVYNANGDTLRIMTTDPYAGLQVEE